MGQNIAPFFFTLEKRGCWSLRPNEPRLQLAINPLLGG
jgi:hypothetical protein